MSGPSDPAQRAWLHNAKRQVVLSAFVIAYVGGMLSAVSHARDPYDADLATSAITLGLLFNWCRFDAQQHDYRRTRMLNWGIFFIAILSLPYYLIRTRGLGRGAKASAVFIGLLFLRGVAQLAGEASARLLAALHTPT